MKYTIALLAGVFMLLSCRKSIEADANLKKSPDKEYLNSLYYDVDDREARGIFIGWIPFLWVEPQVGRVSIWKLFNQDNHGASRCDYIEFLLSDIFTSDIDGDDARKEIDGSDNLAIRSKLTRNLLWKEQRQYPYYKSDTIQLKSWNDSASEYTFKLTGSNFPADTKVYLHDKFTNQYITVPTEHGRTNWYSYNIVSTDVSNNIKSNNPYRFELIISYD